MVTERDECDDFCRRLDGGCRSGKEEMRDDVMAGIRFKHHHRSIEAITVYNLGHTDIFEVSPSNRPCLRHLLLYFSVRATPS